MKRNVLASILGLATVVLITGGLLFAVGAKNSTAFKTAAYDGEVVNDDAITVEIVSNDTEENDSELDSEEILEEDSEVEEDSEKSSEETSEESSEQDSEKESEELSSEEKSSEKTSEEDVEEDDKEKADKDKKKLTAEEEEEAYIQELIKRVENGEELEGEDLKKYQDYVGLKPSCFVEEEYIPYILYDEPQNDYQRMWNEVTSAPTKEESEAKMEILANSHFDGNDMLIPSGTIIYDIDGNVVGVVD